VNRLSHKTRLRDLIQYLDWSYRATVVKEIAHVHFTALTSLDLTRNQIESVEALPSANAAINKAVFKYIDDGGGVSKITSVKIIRKASWPAL
jgi:hypothetical protein